MIAKEDKQIDVAKLKAQGLSGSEYNRLLTALENNKDYQSIKTDYPVEFGARGLRRSYKDIQTGLMTPTAGDNGNYLTGLFYRIFGSYYFTLPNQITGLVNFLTYIAAGSKIISNFETVTLPSGLCGSRDSGISEDGEMNLKFILPQTTDPVGTNHRRHYDFRLFVGQHNMVFVNYKQEKTVVQFDLWPKEAYAGSGLPHMEKQLRVVDLAAFDKIYIDELFKVIKSEVAMHPLNY